MLRSLVRFQLAPPRRPDAGEVHSVLYRFPRGPEGLAVDRFQRRDLASRSAESPFGSRRQGERLGGQPSFPPDRGSRGSRVKARSLRRGVALREGAPPRGRLPRLGWHPLGLGLAVADAAHPEPRFRTPGNVRVDPRALRSRYPRAAVARGAGAAVILGVDGPIAPRHGEVTPKLIPGRV